MNDIPIETEQKFEDGKIGYGECQFCHQMFNFEYLAGEVAEEGLTETLNQWATEKCECSGAREYKRDVRKKEIALKNIEETFRDSFPDTADILISAVVPIMKSKIDKITIDTGRAVKAEMKTDKDGNVVLERTTTIKKTLKNE